MEQISESTKISLRSLTAIEDCNFARLPGGIYSTSYIRQYARAIDYDEAQILELYHRAMDNADSVPSQENVDRRRTPGFRATSDIAS